MRVKSTEKKEERLKRVDMHDFFLKKIHDAIDNERYIEASWLIYSCFENRYFRTVEKIKAQCKYSKGKCKKTSNELALRTKVRCLQRISEADCSCIKDAFPDELFAETLSWVKKRNLMMHNLLQLETYEDMDAQFEESAKEGLVLLNKTYDSCTKFRELFYAEGYEFVFPEEAMDRCSCKPRENKDGD